MLNRIKQRKEWVVSALIGAALASAGFTVPSFNDPELTEIESITNKLVDFQEQYFEERGRYWRGYDILDILPKDGQRLTPINLDEAAPDSEPWTGIEALSETVPFNIRVNRYENIQGHGWNVVFQKEEAGRVLQRGIGFGPHQNSDTYNWKVIRRLTGTASSTP